MVFQSYDGLIVSNQKVDPILHLEHQREGSLHLYSTPLGYCPVEWAIREMASAYLKWPGVGVEPSGDETFLDPDTGRGYAINFNHLSQASLMHIMPLRLLANGE